MSSCVIENLSPIVIEENDPYIAIIEEKVNDRISVGMKKAIHLILE